MSEGKQVLELAKGNEPSQGIIAELERFLEDAKAGRIKSIAIAAQIDGGDVAMTYDIGTGNQHHLIAALSILKHEIITGAVGAKEDP